MDFRDNYYGQFTVKEHPGKNTLSQANDIIRLCSVVVLHKWLEESLANVLNYITATASAHTAYRSFTVVIFLSNVHFIWT